MVYRALILSLLVHVGVLVVLRPFGRRTVEANHQAKVEVGLVEVVRHPSPPSAAPTRSSAPNRARPPAEREPPVVDPAPTTSGTQTLAPTGAAPRTGAVAAPTGAAPNALATYIERVRSDLNRAKVYPEEASEREQQGLVTLGLTLAPDGRVIDVKVESPSAYRLLNDAALRAVAEIKRFPPFPDGLGGETLHLHVPVLFKINHD